MEVTSIDLSLLASYPGQYQQALLRKLYQAFDAGATGISVMPGTKSKLNLHKLLTIDGLKPYSGDFNNRANGISFAPRVLSVSKAQIDTLIHPSNFIGTFMEQNRGRGENPNNTTIPFAEVVFDAVNKQVADEVVREVIYNGAGSAAFTAYNAGTAYSVGNLISYTQDSELRYFRCIVATTAGQNPDTNAAKWAWAGARAITKGFGKIITDEIASTGIAASQIQATGAITNANAYAQFLQVWRGLPEVVRTRGGIIYTSLSNYEALMDDYENKIKKNFEEVNGIVYLAKTDRKAQVLPVNWLSGSGRLIATAAGNLWMGTDQTSDMNAIKALERMYAIEYGCSFMIGFQIADLEPLCINDQA